MARQPETNSYPVDIYQLETTDPVQGGVGGLDNGPLLQLASRTNYLKGIVDSLTSSFSGLAPKDSAAFIGTPTAPTPAASDNTLKLSTTAFVQRAIDGITSVSTVGGTTTLTADQAALPNLTISGALTSNAVVNIPTASVGAFRVANTTTGNFTVTVKTSTGVGIIVPQGARMLLFNDSVNIVDTFTAASALTLGGALTLNAGATLSNAQYLAAKLASGTATPIVGFTAANDLILGSTSSTHGNTLFQNNGTSLAALTAAGSLGVGTVTPATKLHVLGTGGVESRVTSNTTGDAKVSLEAVGILAGIAARTATGLLALTVAGLDKLTLSAASTLALGAVAHTEALNVAGNAYLQRTGGASLRLVDQYSEVGIKSVPDSSVPGSHLDLVSGGATGLRLTSGGQVGVGTTTIGVYKMAIAATGTTRGLVVSSNSGQPQITGTDGNVQQFIGFTGGAGTSAVAYSGTQSAHAYCLTIGGQEVARLDVNGNLGLGTNAPTTVAGYRALSMFGTTGSLIDLQSSAGVRGRITGNAAGLTIDTMTTAAMSLCVNGAEVARLASNGMAIGGAATGASLTTYAGESVRMVGSSSYMTGMDSTGAIRTGYMQFNAGTSLKLMAENNAQLLIGTQGVSRIICDTTGGVGIGMQPSYNLDILGNTRTSGSFIGHLIGSVDGDITGHAASADIAGSVAWGNVSGRPTAVSAFVNDSQYLTLGSFTGAQSVASNGYCTLPGGLIMQWGVTPAIATDTTTPVTFPVAFPHACFNVQGTCDYVGNVSSDCIAQVTAITRTGLTMMRDSGGGAGQTGVVYWFAIGN